MKFVKVTEYRDGTVHLLNPERIEQMQEVWGREWKTAIHMMDGQPGADYWLRVRESSEAIVSQMEEAPGE